MQTNCRRNKADIEPLLELSQGRQTARKRRNAFFFWKWCSPRNLETCSLKSIVQTAVFLCNRRRLYILFIWSQVQCDKDLFVVDFNLFVVFQTILYSLCLSIVPQFIINKVKNSLILPKATKRRLWCYKIITKERIVCDRLSFISGKKIIVQQVNKTPMLHAF